MSLRLQFGKNIYRLTFTEKENCYVFLDCTISEPTVRDRTIFLPASEVVVTNGAGRKITQRKIAEFGYGVVRTPEILQLVRRVTTFDDMIVVPQTKLSGLYTGCSILQAEDRFNLKYPKNAFQGMSISVNGQVHKGWSFAVHYVDL